MKRRPHPDARGSLQKAFLAAALTATAGCQSGESGAAPPSRTDPAVLDARAQALTRKDVQRIPAAEPAATGEVPARILEDVRRHLARRTGADPAGFEVVRAESTQWPDGAMGCPQPDLIYTPRPVDGYWVVLRHAGRDYDYRLSRAGTLVLCEGMVVKDAPPI